MRTYFVLTLIGMLMAGYAHQDVGTSVCLDVPFERSETISMPQVGTRPRLLPAGLPVYLKTHQCMADSGGKRKTLPECLYERSDGRSDAKRAG